MSRLRWIAAFIAAPLLPLILVSFLLGGLGGWRAIATIAPLVLLAEYAAMIVAGLSLYWLAARKGRPSRLVAVCAGAFVAPLPWLALIAWGRFQQPEDTNPFRGVLLVVLVVLILGGLLGALGGLIGWQVAYAEKKPTT